MPKQSIVRNKIKDRLKSIRNQGMGTLNESGERSDTVRLERGENSSIIGETFLNTEPSIKLLRSHLENERKPNRPQNKIHVDVRSERSFQPYRSPLTQRNKRESLA